MVVVMLCVRAASGVAIRSWIFTAGFLHGDCRDGLLVIVSPMWLAVDGRYCCESKQNRDASATCGVRLQHAWLEDRGWNAHVCLVVEPRLAAVAA
ncbi:hypothetical protein GGR70_000809 [Xanthomonas campestris]|uniref:hypothetical protein n=1 Tax=Xanthomonas campestris TaxID=339 RepID=UPI00216A9F10|nr:hypothetical protein [Xanthomonas campestris]MCS3845874.1 hypothetical protein [Xanthomonas campestris]MEA9607797.1 hypothetical protein [Xanthomonas campestris pv. plantaginis]